MFATLLMLRPARDLFVAIAAVLLWPSAALAGQAASARYVYFLHGQIVEDAGQTAISPRFGRYDYPGMIAAFRTAGLITISEARPSRTDPDRYADKVARQIRAQVKRGVPPSHITVVGASKGSVIAALVSTKLQLRGIRYVLIANCNDWLIRTFNPRLSGAILSIYDASDDIGGTCRPLVKRSPGVTFFREVRLATGLGHGFIYRPRPEWIAPAIAWAKR